MTEKNSDIAKDLDTRAVELPVVINQLPADGGIMKVSMPPAEIIAGAQEMAKVLTNIVKQAGLSRKFGAKEYLYFEAWQTIGRFHNCTPVTIWTKPIERKGQEKPWGWECKVDVVNADGRVIASAEGSCARDESNWFNRDDYAIRSMAQTRTAGKALRSAFAWVAVLAGYEATPAEEMKQEYVKPVKIKGNFEYLEEVQKIKKRLFAVKGKDMGEGWYRDMLAKHGVQKSNQLKSRKKQGAFYRELRDMVVSFESPNHENDLPDFSGIDTEYKRLVTLDTITMEQVEAFFMLCDPGENIETDAEYKGYWSTEQYADCVEWIYEQYKALNQ